MGIEQTIQGLTDAVVALTKALAASHDIISLASPTLPAAKVAGPKPAATPTASATATSTPTPPAPAAPEPAAASPSDEVSYVTVAKAITDTFQKDKAKVIAALAKFGAAKGPQLKVEDYADFLKELAA